MLGAIRPNPVWWQTAFRSSQPFAQHLMVRRAQLRNETATGNKTDCLVHAPLSPTERRLQGSRAR